MKRGLNMRFGEFRKEIKKFFKKNSKRKNFVFRFLPNIRKKMERIRAIERRKRFAVLGISVIFLLVAGFAVAGVIGSFSTGDINKGLVGHWPLDSAHLNSTTNRVDDISGHGNHGTNSGATLTTDRYGQANGANEASYNTILKFSDNESVDFGFNDSFSMSIWFKTLEAPARLDEYGATMGIFLKGSTTDSYGFQSSGDGLDNVNFRVRGNASGAVSYSISLLNTWVHVVGTYNGGNKELTFYVDGNFINSVTYTGDDFSNAEEYWIGGGRVTSGNGSNAGGRFIADEAMVYNRALSKGEVKKLYEIYKPKFSVGSANKGLVGHWPLRPEGAGAEGTVNLSYLYDNDLNSIVNWNNSGTATWNTDDNTINPPDLIGKENYKIVSMHKDTSGSSHLGVGRATITTSTTYTVSVWVYLDTVSSPSGAQPYIRPQSDNQNRGNLYYNGVTSWSTWPKRQWIRLSRTFTSPAVDVSYMYISSYLHTAGDKIYYFAPQIEQKDHLTPFTGPERLDRTADNTPNSNHGEIYGAEIRNHGASFNGSSDYILATHDGSLSFQSGDFTASAWAKSDVLDASYDGIFTADTTGDAAWKIVRNTGNAYFHGFFGGTSLNYSSVSAGDWHYYTMTKSGTTLTIYLDGKQVTSGACPATHAVSNNELVLGSYRVQNAKDGYHMFDGQIADVKIYDRALSGDEVLELYQGADVAGAVLDMPLSDKTGFKDISGNDNHGTNYGADIIGEAGYFDATDDYIDVSSLDISEIKNISFWVNAADGLLRSGLGYYPTLFTLNGGLHISGGPWTGSATDETLHIWNNATMTHIREELSPKTWYHVNINWNGSSYDFYLDSVKKATYNRTEGSCTLWSNITAMHIGDNYATYRYKGFLEGLRFYNRSLSDGGVSVGQTAKGEIGALYAKGRAGSSVGTSTTNLNKGLVGQWDLKSKNEKVGSSLLTNGDFEIDISSWTNSGSCPTFERNTSNPILGIGDFHWAGNSANWSGAISNAFLVQEGMKYRVTFTYRKATGVSNVALKIGKDNSITCAGLSGAVESWLSATSNTNFSYTFTAGETDTTTYLILRNSAGAGSTSELYVDNISLKEIQTADSTPYGNHGTIYGATVGDDYTSFNGTSDYVDTNEDNNFDIASELSITGWVYLGGSSYRSILSKRNWSSGAGGGYIFGISSANTLTFEVANDSISKRWSEGPTVSGGTWHYVAVTYDGINVKLTVDNNTNGFSDGIGNITGNSSIVKIGTQNNLYYWFNGSIANVKIYNRVLSGAEVKLLYDKGR